MKEHYTIFLYNLYHTDKDVEENMKDSQEYKSAKRHNKKLIKHEFNSLDSAVAWLQSSMNYLDSHDQCKGFGIAYDHNEGKKYIAYYGHN